MTGDEGREKEGTEGGRFAEKKGDEGGDGGEGGEGGDGGDGGEVGYEAEEVKEAPGGLQSRHSIQFRITLQEHSISISRVVLFVGLLCTFRS